MSHRFVAILAVLTMVGISPTFAAKREEARTPPRLSFAQGEVSFWRPGADDWAQARVNTALAAGDALYAGDGANLELQVGPRAFVRAGENTQVGLEDQEPDFLQLKVTAGHAAIDVRELPPGQSIELDTPNAAFTIARAGYYRVDVTQDSTTFISRRGGQAAAIPAGGEAVDVGSNQELVVQGEEAPQVASYDAPALDDWDRWNYDRSDSALAAGRGDDVPPDMYGSGELGQYGSWRNTEPYGRVWVPSGVGPTWAPYTTGQWMWDPSYGWTWVDDAPWGWAPYHYGRWVYVDDYWAWAPGPILAPPVYAPALVAFFGFPGVHVGIGFGTPIGWVALGWGEPLFPWWGPVGFIGRPCWDGWHGPHHDIFVNNTTIINNFANTHVPHAVVAIGRDRFGNGAVERARIGNILHAVDGNHLQQIRGALPVRGGPQSLVAGAGPGRRPPEAMMARRVVATRAPSTAMAAHDPAATRLASRINPQPRLVPAVEGRMSATGRMADTSLRGAPQHQQPSAALHAGNERPSAAVPRGDVRMRAPMGGSPRLAPPPPPHSAIGARQAPSQGQAGVGRSQPPMYRLGPGQARNDPAAGPGATVSRRMSPPPPPRSHSAPSVVGNAPGRGEMSSRLPQNHMAAPQAARQQLQTRPAPPPPPRIASASPHMSVPRAAAPRFSQPSTMADRSLAPPPPPRAQSPRVQAPRAQVPQTQARLSPPQMPAPRSSVPRMSAPAPRMSAPAPRMSAPASRMSAPQMAAPRMSAPQHVAAPRAPASSGRSFSAPAPHAGGHGAAAAHGQPR